MFKQVKHEINWLDEIDGLTVKQAIDYLSTLDQSMRLNHYLEGDTHSCNIEVSLIEDVLMTEKEEKDFIKGKRISKLNEELKRAESAVKYYIEDALYYEKQGKPFPDHRSARLEECKNRIVELKTELDQLK